MTARALVRTCSPAAFAFATSELGQTTTRAQNSRAHRARQFGGTHSARLPWTFPCCWRSSSCWQLGADYRSARRSLNASIARGARPAKRLCSITLRCARPCCRYIRKPVDRTITAQDEAPGSIRFVVISCGVAVSFFGVSRTSGAVRFPGSFERALSFGPLTAPPAVALLSRKHRLRHPARRRPRRARVRIDRDPATTGSGYFGFPCRSHAGCLVSAASRSIVCAQSATSRRRQGKCDRGRKHSQKQWAAFPVPVDDGSITTAHVVVTFFS
jgi:hypothetical protein